jgi:hypothetical protein
MKAPTFRELMMSLPSPPERFSKRPLVSEPVSVSTPGPPAMEPASVPFAVAASSMLSRLANQKVIAGFVHTTSFVPLPAQTAVLMTAPGWSSLKVTCPMSAVMVSLLMSPMPASNWA